MLTMGDLAIAHSPTEYGGICSQATWGALQAPQHCPIVRGPQRTSRNPRVSRGDSQEGGLPGTRCPASAQQVAGAAIHAFQKLLQNPRSGYFGHTQDQK